MAPKIGHRQGPQLFGGQHTRGANFTRAGKKARAAGNPIFGKALRPLSKPPSRVSRQPIRPGQYRKLSALRRYSSNSGPRITNNFWDAFEPCSCNCNCDSGSGGMNWLGWLGLGTGLLGSILSLFGKKTEGGGTEAAAQTTQTPGQTEQPAPNNNTPVDGGSNTSTPAQEGEETETTVDTYDWSQLSEITCTDESKRTRNITGSLNILEEDKTGQSEETEETDKKKEQAKKAPKKFSITTNAGYVYVFEKVSTTSDDGENSDCTVKYKCIYSIHKGKDGNYKKETYTSGHEYNCTLDENGKPKLKQIKEMQGYSFALSGSVTDSSEDEYNTLIKKEEEE